MSSSLLQFIFTLCSMVDMKKLTITRKAKETKEAKRKVLGADVQLVDTIDEIAKRTGRRMKDVTDMLLRFALENVIIDGTDNGAGE